MRSTLLSGGLWVALILSGCAPLSPLKRSDGPDCSASIEERQAYYEVHKVTVENQHFKVLGRTVPDKDAKALFGHQHPWDTESAYFTPKGALGLGLLSSAGLLLAGAATDVVQMIGISLFAGGPGLTIERWLARGQDARDYDQRLKSSLCLAP